MSLYGMMLCQGRTSKAHCCNGKQCAVLVPRKRTLTIAPFLHQRTHCMPYIKSKQTSHMRAASTPHCCLINIANPIDNTRLQQELKASVLKASVSFSRLLHKHIADRHFTCIGNPSTLSYRLTVQVLDGCGACTFLTFLKVIP
jgi:hypothetical protein